jgi:transcriptional regulator with XRE-family HTH domain
MEANPNYRGRGGQTRLAEKTGVPQGTISRIRDDKAVPETQTVDKLTKEFGVTTDWFTKGQGPKFAAEVSGRAADRWEPPATVETGPKGAIERISALIDDQHRAAAITDDDAVLLRAAVQAVQTNMPPTIRAAVLLMLSTQTQAEAAKSAANQGIAHYVNTPHSMTGESGDTPAKFAKRRRADIRSAADPEGETHHEKGKQGA